MTPKELAKSINPRNDRILTLLETDLECYDAKVRMGRIFIAILIIFFFLKLHIEYIKLLAIIHLSKNFGSV